jgi:alkaline phosphatase D
VRYLATWDDHDFGPNDSYGAGERGPGRLTDALRGESKRAFMDALDALNAPHGAAWTRHRDARPWLTQADEGVYSSALFGPPGAQVRVIVLDTRAYQDPSEGALLGEAQWAWLEGVLNAEDGAAFTLIASSIQFVVDVRGSGPGKYFGESWGRGLQAELVCGDEGCGGEHRVRDFSAERLRLMRLVRESGRTGVVFLSGDKHIGTIDVVGDRELRRRTSKGGVEGGIGYPFYDVTSSGLSHALESHGRIHLGAARLVYGRTPYRVDRHFGGIEFHWRDPADPQLTLTLRDEGGEVMRVKDRPRGCRYQLTLGVDDLSPGAKPRRFTKRCAR